MALIRAMNSAISGLRSQQFKIDVIGDNLANSTTTGFKASRVNFHTVLNQTLSFGSSPQGNLGGINPLQIGLGVGTAETTRNFTQGELETTGVASDMGIDGDGFFILKDANGGQVFSRDGSFGISSQNLLVNPSNGYIVQGINANLTTFTIASGSTLQGVNIPLGQVQIAVATTVAKFNGNLNGAGNQALEGTIIESSVLRNGSGGPAAVSGTLLTNLFRTPDTAGPDIDLGIDTGDTIIVSAKKGGRTLPAKVFRVGTTPIDGDDGYGTTLGEFTRFLQRSLGINTGSTELLISATRDDDNNPNTPGVTGVATGYAGGPPYTSVTQTGRNFTTEGVQVGDIIRWDTGIGAGQISQITAVGTSSITFNALSSTLGQPAIGDEFSVHEPPRVSIGGFPSTAGKLRIAGNVGTSSDITDLSIVTSDGFTFSPFYTRQSASGESTITNLTVYDSIGNAHLVELTLVLETKGGTNSATGEPGNVFRFFADANDNQLVSGTTLLGLNRVAGTGTITYGINGQFLSQNNNPTITINLLNQGASTPLSFRPDLSGTTGFADQNSQVFLREQDGFPMGTLADYSVGVDGLVTGIFSNGVTRSIAQIMLARFSNPEGLQALDANDYLTSSNSGQPIVSKPGDLGIGGVRSGALEASNVDFSREFTSLIVAQRAFQANTRVITTADNMLQDLIRIVG